MGMTVIVTFDRAAGELYLGSDEELMHAALVEARKAMAGNEVPIGAVVAVGDEIVAAAFNQPISTVDPTAHAEIRSAARGRAEDRETTG